MVVLIWQYSLGIIPAYGSTCAESYAMVSCQHACDVEFKIWVVKASHNPLQFNIAGALKAFLCTLFKFISGTFLVYQGLYMDKSTIPTTSWLLCCRLQYTTYESRAL